jgi:glycerol-3-phosphate acyltransferase PlsY
MYIALMSLLAVGGYFVGALPIGYWYARYIHNIDITKRGSGNIGATNCERVIGGRFTFILIFLADALKAAGYLWVVQQLVITSFNFYALVAGMLLLGNGISCFLGGQGGKGVSTYIGILAILMPQLLIPFLLTWLLCKVATYSSAVASVCASGIIPLFYFFQAKNYTQESMFFLCCVAVWIMLRHKSNIVASL